MLQRDAGIKLGDRVAITMRDEKHHPIFGTIEQTVRCPVRKPARVGPALSWHH